ncbi:MAG: hypothetical protein ACI9Y1_001957 [Lentisphaeria bacterium]|jgi:hypothetical protein
MTFNENPTKNILNKNNGLAAYVAEWLISRVEKRVGVAVSRDERCAMRANRDAGSGQYCSRGGGVYP